MIPCPMTPIQRLDAVASQNSENRHRVGAGVKKSVCESETAGKVSTSDLATEKEGGRIHPGRRY